MNNIFSTSVSILVLICIGFLLYSFLHLPNGNKKNDFENLLHSCNLNSDFYTTCYQKGNSVYKLQDISSLPPETPVVIKVNLSTLTNETQPYFVCVSDLLIHPPYKMPNYFGDDILLSAIYAHFGDNQTGFGSYSYDPTKTVFMVTACSKKLDSASSYTVTTYGLTLPPASKDAQVSRITLLSISAYPDGDYKNISDFLNNINISKTIFSLNTRVLKE